MNALKVNEKAEFYCELTKENELADILEFSKINNLPIIWIGEGTNIVPINSIEGLVVKNSLKGIKVIDEDTTEVASGENWHDFVKWTLLNDKFGLENLALIPGTVGAGPIQNIGAYGSEISNSIKEVLVFNIDSNDYEILTNEQCEFGNWFWKVECKCSCFGVQITTAPPATTVPSSNSAASGKSSSSSGRRSVR